MVQDPKWGPMLHLLKDRLGVQYSAPPWGSLTSVAQCFDLQIPWCNGQLNWKVILSSSPSDCGLDFVFDDEYFFPLSPSNGNNELKDALLRWDSSDSSKLVEVIQKLLGSFRSHQQSKMRALGDSRLHFELETMSEDIQQNCELLVREEFSGIKACFGLELDTVNLEPLKEMLEFTSSECALIEKEKFMLYVTFPVGASRAPEVHIKVPELLAPIFPPSVTSPSWTQNACLAEFRPSATESLSEFVCTYVERLKSRSAVIGSLTETLGHPLEVVSGRKECACYMMACGTTQFLLFVELGMGFPDEKPSLCVQMIRRPSIDGPFRELAFDRWSPRWDTSEMARRIVMFLKEEAPKLKPHNNI